MKNNSITKKFTAVAVLSALLLAGCSDPPEKGGSSIRQSSTFSSSETVDSSTEHSSETPTENDKENEMKIVINGVEFTVKLSGTKAAEEFKRMLPLTLDMSELNGNEKYFYLDTSLSAQSESVGHINCGDIMLYGSSCVVLFYESFNTPYTYTRIGQTENPEGLKSAVGSGSVTVEFK